MKRHNLAFLGWRVLALSLLLGFFASAYCQAVEVAVLIEQRPPAGGEVAGGTGVRYFPFGSLIRLTAIPKPGYHFLYWLGDVTDPLSFSTSAHLEGPMIIVAVYAKVSREVSEVGEVAPRGVGDGGGDGRRAEEPTPPPSSFKPVWRPSEPPIAEPSTILLFGLAAVMLRRMRRHI